MNRNDFAEGGEVHEPSAAGPLRPIAVTLASMIVGAHLAVGVASCSGCAAGSPLPTTPREQARAAVLVLAEGTRAADEACAAEALAQQSLPLAERCSQAYSAARTSLLIASRGVDAWDTAERGNVACATAQGAAAAGELVAAIRSYGGAVPPVLVDGLELYRTVLGVTCTVADAGGAS